MPTTGKLYLGTTQIGGTTGATPDVNGWYRPADWLDMPTIVGTDEKFAGLHAVYGDSDFVALRASGAYTVDWGDGSAPENIATNTTAYHKFSYAGCAGTDCSRGYRQAIVTVVPQAGQHLTALSLNYNHNQSGLVAARAVGWLDIHLAMPNGSATGFVLGASTQNVFLRQLEHFKQIGTWPQTTMTYLFSGCSNLRSVEIEDSSHVSILTAAFYNCVSMVNAPALDTSSATDMASMFVACYSLQTVPLYNTANVTTMASTFQNCNSLPYVPAWNVAGASFSSTFASCLNLQWCDFNGAVNAISFTNCRLSADALNNIYTRLGTPGVAKTITVSGNWGVASDDSTIATGKGWTVTG